MIDTVKLHAYRQAISLLGLWLDQRKAEIAATLDGAIYGIHGSQLSPELQALLASPEFRSEPDAYEQAVFLLRKQHENFLELERSYHGVWFDVAKGREVEMHGEWPEREG